MSDRAPLLLMAAGGTGGHMFPAQSLAEHMLRQGWRVKLSTDARGARYTGGFPHSIEIEQIKSATFARGGLLAKAMVPFRIAGGVMGASAAMLRDKPDVVVGFGGYPSIPALSAARLLGVPAMVHEQNGVLGRVNRAFAKRVAKVACGTWPTFLATWPSSKLGLDGHDEHALRSTLASSRPWRCSLAFSRMAKCVLPATSVGSS